MPPKSEFPLLTPAFYNTRLGERFATHLRVFLHTELQVDQASLALSLFNALSWTLTSMVNTNVPYTQVDQKRALMRELWVGLHTMSEKLRQTVGDEKHPNA